MPDAKQLTESAQKKPAILDQQETAYTPVSTTPGEMCAGCMWYRQNYCHIVANWPETIEPTGWCNEYRVATPPPLSLDNALPVVIVDPATLFDDSQEMALPTTRRSLADFVVQTVKGIIAPAAPAKLLETPSKAFTAWKGKDGQYFWLARHTGKYVDREDEILADHAHEEFVQRVQSGKVPMPELWTWHKKGTAHGVADFVWKSGGFVLALGHFTGTKEQQERAAKFYQEHPDTTLSHMFKFPQGSKRRKVYHAYNTVEITTLPDGAEAFPYTTFEVNDMPLTKDQIEMIRGIGGDEMVTRAESADAKAQKDTTKMDAAGVASKQAPSVDNFEGSQIPDDENKALMLAQKDIDDRLKTVEKLSAQITQQGETIKTLTTEIGTLKTNYTQAVERANDLEKKLAEYQAVAPPASQSSDTILGQRETSLLQHIAADAKSGDSLSLIEQAFGGKKQVEPAT